MGQTAYNNRVRELVGQPLNLLDKNFILTVPQNDRAAGNMNRLFIQGSVFNSFTTKSHHPRIVASSALNGCNIINVYSGLVKSNDDILACDHRVRREANG